MVIQHNFPSKPANQSKAGRTTSNSDAVCGVWFRQLHFQAGFITVWPYANVGLIELLFEEGTNVIPHVKLLQFFELLLIFNLGDADHIGAVYTDLQSREGRVRFSSNNNLNWSIFCSCFIINPFPYYS